MFLFSFFCLSVFLYSQLLHIAWRLLPKPATTTNDNSNIMKQNKHNDGYSKKSKKDNKKRKTETKKQNIEKNNSKSNSKNSTTTATATAAAAATTTTPTITTSKTGQITPSVKSTKSHTTAMIRTAKSTAEGLLLLAFGSRQFHPAPRDLRLFPIRHTHARTSFVFWLGHRLSLGSLVQN